MRSGVGRHVSREMRPRSRQGLSSTPGGPRRLGAHRDSGPGRFLRAAPFYFRPVQSLGCEISEADGSRWLIVRREGYGGAHESRERLPTTFPIFASGYPKELPHVDPWIFHCSMAVKAARRIQEFVNSFRGLALLHGLELGNDLVGVGRGCSDDNQRPDAQGRGRGRHPESFHVKSLLCLAGCDLPSLPVYRQRADCRAGMRAAGRRPSLSASPA